MLMSARMDSTMGSCAKQVEQQTSIPKISFFILQFYRKIIGLMRIIRFKSKSQYLADMMRKALYSTLFFGILLSLWGCPYLSNVPLGESVEPVKESVIGLWVPENEASEESPSYYDISEEDSVTYRIIHNAFNKEKKEYTKLNYRGHTTSIDRNMFLNMVEDGQKEYLMHKLVVMPNKLVLFEVTDNIDEKFATSEEMHAFFKQNMHLSFFYNKDEVQLIRKPK